jgi:hypothetical protein
MVLLFAAAVALSIQEDAAASAEAALTGEPVYDIPGDAVVTLIAGAVFCLFGAAVFGSVSIGAGAMARKTGKIAGKTCRDRV